jgi:hypothetical protein
MELSLSREATSCAATQEFPILWNHKFHDRVFLSQVSPAHTTPSCLAKIHLNIIPPCLGFPSGIFPSGFPTKFLYIYN